MPRVCSPQTSLSDHFLKTISMDIPKIPIKQKIKIAPWYMASSKATVIKAFLLP